MPPNISRKDELSFGVELEFLFFFKLPTKLPRSLWDELNDATSEPPSGASTPPHGPGASTPPYGPEEVTLTAAEEARLPPPLTLPPEIEYYPENEEPDHIQEKDTARFWATNLLRDAIMSVDGAKMEGQPFPANMPDQYKDMYLARDFWDDFSGWTVKNDASVKEGNLRVKGYECLAFEVTSPALWDRPESHRHVYKVVEVLVRRFRLRVNLRTGFHVHVGGGMQTVRERKGEDTPQPSGGDGGWGPVRKEEKGKDNEEDACGRKFSREVLKRAAALMWAADGFLCHAHPPERGMNNYSPPLRFSSRLAHGLRLRPVKDEKNGRMVLKEVALDDDLAVRSIAGTLPEEDLPSHNFTRLNPTLFPATRPSELTDEDARQRFSAMSATGFIGNLSDLRLHNKTVDSGVAHIMNCKTRSEVAQLFAPPDRERFFNRANYNLRNYLGGSTVNRHNNTTTGVSSATVEFREATGSLAPEWVTTWASICLGFFRFARDASDARYWAVIEKLADAESRAQRGAPKGHGYDMVSLLFDMGLFAEALFLESKLRDDPVRFWYPVLLGRKQWKNWEEYEEGEYGGPGYWQLGDGGGWAFADGPSTVGHGVQEKGKPEEGDAIKSGRSSPFIIS